MNLFAAAKTLVGGRTALAGGAAAALGGLALLNRAAARRAEREHTPRGEFIAVDGVRLHHTGRGVGQRARTALRGAGDGASGKGARRC